MKRFVHVWNRYVPPEVFSIPIWSNSRMMKLCIWFFVSPHRGDSVPCQLEAPEHGMRPVSMLSLEESHVFSLWLVSGNDTSTLVVD